MSNINARLVGVELYFDDLVAAKNFYEGTLGLNIFGERPGHHAQFNVGRAFLCLEKKGVEDYPSRDKAVIFLEVPSVATAVEAIGEERFVHIARGSENSGSPWAVLHDTEGHNVILLEAQRTSGEH
jgi:predicted enzyme related to lactoylglutathione lyase